MFHIENIYSALQNEQKSSCVNGWIFTDFFHRDKLTASILALDEKSVSTRRWIYIVPVTGEPIKIVHAIEKNILDSLPGTSVIYSGQKELQKYLQEFSGQTFAILSDENIAVVSTVDAGFVDFLHSCNIKTVSAARLIQRSQGLLTQAGIKSHERAAALLYRIIYETWDFVSDSFYKNTALYESDVLSFILQKFADYSLVTHHNPIVAFGKNTGNPHYSVEKQNNVPAKKGDIIQFDIFAKEAFARDDEGNISSESAIYADISWVGVYDTDIPSSYRKDFAKLCEARDTVYNTLSQKVHESAQAIFDVTGYELDKGVRDSLTGSGYADLIKHRTGHSIGTECHDSGVNLDSIEFPDFRTLLNGSCFS
ncbi:MAG: M24 family metallopeptidase, partial [Spirochaetales bacterium]